MADLLIAPTPVGEGGPSLAVARMVDMLERHGYRIVDRFWTHWDLALVNVGGGMAGPGVVAMGRPFVYRPAGFYIRDIFAANDRPWRRQYDWYNRLYFTYIKRADWVVFQSAYARDAFSQATSRKPERYSIVYNGVDTELFCPGGEGAGGEGGTRACLAGGEVPVLGAVGKIRHEKVVDLIEVSRRISSPHSIRLVGRIGDEDRRRVEEYAVRRRLPLAVMGHVPYRELAAQYRAIDVLLHLNSSDWCPSVVVESLACGTPVVCHGYGGSAELVGDGCGGRAVDGNPLKNDDPFHLAAAAAVEEVLDDLRGYRERARRRAVHQFNLEKMAAGYLLALGRVLGR